MPTTIKLRRDTAANWTSTNPTLAAGEVGIETDTLRLKIGNGATAWVSLAYAILQSMAADTLLGRGNGGGTGVPQSISLGSNLSLTGTTLNVTAGSGTSGLDARSSIYPPFTPAGVDDEFNDGSFSGWTLVNDGTHLGTMTETNDTASLFLPGTDTAAHLQAYMKATTVNIGDSIQVCLNGAGLSGNFHMAGLIFADGATYAAGVQSCLAFVPSSANQHFQAFAMTNYNTQGTNGVLNGLGNTMGANFMRFTYSAANTFVAYLSPDGISWAAISGSLSRTITPTHVGFFATSWGAVSQFVWSFRFFRKV